MDIYPQAFDHHWPSPAIQVTPHVLIHVLIHVLDAGLYSETYFILWRAFHAKGDITVHCVK